MEAVGVTPHRRAGGGRGRRRASSARTSAKKMAKQIVKEILDREKNRGVFGASDPGKRRPSVGGLFRSERTSASTFERVLYNLHSR